MASSQPFNSKSLRIGVMAEAIQLADVMGMDVLGSLAKPDIDIDALLQNPHFAPLGGVMAQCADKFIKVEWFFISSTLEPATTTINFKWMPTVTYDDCPRDLDIVLTGGPWPTHRPVQADKFVREAWPKTRFWLTTCTGAMWIADSGVLDGKQATTNRGFLSVAKQTNPKVEWLDQRWVITEKEFEGEGQSEVWTGAGAAAGLHMIAAFCQSKFDADLVNLALGGLDLQPGQKMGQFYE